MRLACEVAMGWSMGWRRRGALAPLRRHQRLCAASAPPVRGRPRLRHTQHAVFFLQFRITAIYVMLSTCVKSCPRVPLHTGLRCAPACGGSLYTVTSLSCSSIQVMMRPARLPIVRFGPLIPTRWRADCDHVCKNILLPRAPSPSAVKEKRLQRAPCFCGRQRDARPLSAARTRHAVQR